MGKNKGKASQAGKRKPPREPKPPAVRATSLVGAPSIEVLADGKQIVLWMDVHGHGRIKVASRSPGTYHSSAADPNAALAAETGAGEYCALHGEQLRELYGQLV